MASHMAGPLPSLIEGRSSREVWYPFNGANLNLVFWACLGLVAYSYLGYPIWLWLVAHSRRIPTITAPFAPKVSVIIAARNEEKNLPRKLQNLRELIYPKDRLEIIVVSDGSIDATASILQLESNWITPIILETANGKAVALNEGVKRATGEILVFLDARQTIEPNAVSELTSSFSDPSVGAASGELMLESEQGSSALGIYWKIEKMIRKLESATGGMIGVTGAIYAIRRELYTEMPPGTILDDVFVPMNVVRNGKRVVFQPKAIAHDRIFAQEGREFSRKVRTLTGNYQLVRLSPWLLSNRNPLLFRFVSHKLLRLAVPILLILMLITSGLSASPFQVIAFWCQGLFYMLAILGYMNHRAMVIKPIAIASTLLMLNVAAAIALYYFISGRRNVWLTQLPSPVRPEHRCTRP
jgi:cellulose synthase/poly-beta-1,6-N-acetylglucosamine synthase-like glycosyltransferase